ncbi:MAG: prepilin-type N-terminal cleavage/methylation domain-containing protein [Deltaproteobacteria bacterium]|nr:prepilin-type N-terminal cleavage/methylation domain-containing protein [Deltaproteobacteria bacterium]
MTLRVGKSRNSGFTLIELLVALALIGLILGLAVGRMGKLLDREMKHAANRLGSTIRYLYNKAASDGVTFRLVLDMEEQKYWVESTTEVFALRREEEEGPGTRDQGPGTEDEEGEEENLGEPETIKPKEATFTPQESFLLKPVSLPKGIYFKDVYAEHQTERLDTGRAFIHFFARGYVERSVINLRDGDDEVRYSLTVNPITGAVKIEKGYKEPEVER